MSPAIMAGEKQHWIDNPLLLGVEGRKVQSYVRVKSVKIAPIELKGVDFFVASLGESGGIDATLGANFLGSFDVEIDPVNNVASFFLQNTCGDRVVHWPHQDFVEVPLTVDSRNKHFNVTLTLDDKKIPAIIDTGSSETFLDLKTAKRLFDLDENSPGMQALGTATDSKNQHARWYRHQFKSLALGDIVFKNPWITLASADDSGPTLILGMHQLHGLHLYFSYSQQRLYLTTARGDIVASQTGSAQNVSQAGRPDPLDEMNARDFLASAAAALGAGDNDAALKATDQALKLDPNSAFAYLIAAEAAFRRGERDLALEKAAAADRNHPGDAGVYLKRARFYSRVGEHELASKDAEKLLQLQPKSSWALNRACWYGALAGKLESALSECNAALAMVPDSASILDSRAMVHFKAGRLDEALADFDAVLHINPREAHSLYGRAMIEQQKGDKSGADDDITAAQRIDPKVAENFEK